MAVPQPMNAEPLHVVFALHDAQGTYWLNTAVALTSVALHASRPIEFHILHDDSLSAIAHSRLTQIAHRLNASVTAQFVALPASIAQDFGQFSPASIFRLMIPRFFANTPLVIYLDSDLVCNGLDIAEIAASAPTDCAVSAVPDPYIALWESHRQQLDRLGLSAQRYVNTGVLALRPPMIQDDLLDAFVAFEAKFGRTIHPDQDFLNYHFANRIGLLHSRFNSQVGPQAGSLFWSTKAYRHKMLHYVGEVKPMHGRLAPGTLWFWRYTAFVPELEDLLDTQQFTYLYPNPSQLDSVLAHAIPKSDVAP